MYGYSIFGISSGTQGFLFDSRVKKLDFEPIQLKLNLHDATDLILSDEKHIDNNPKLISQKDILLLLEEINLGNVLN